MRFACISKLTGAECKTQVRKCFVYSTEGHTEGAVIELSALDAGSTTQGNVFFLKLSKAEFYAGLLYFEHFLKNLSVVLINT